MIESVSSWCTPTVLFCFLNLMIGTIFITSSLKSEKKSNQLTRSPSLLQRVKSFNFNFPDPFYLTEADPSPPSLLQRVSSINLSFSRSEKSSLYEEEQARNVEVESHVESHVTRESESKLLDSFVSSSCTLHPSQSVTYVKTPAKVLTRMIAKSASEKKMTVAEEEAKQLDKRRPATARETTGGDEAVDKKADDFINKFRQQLKLQRLDSIIRYKEMLNRGVGR